MTLAEFNLALDGYLESKGIKKDKNKLMSKNELLDLIDKYGG